MLLPNTIYRLLVIWAFLAGLGCIYEFDMSGVTTVEHSKLWL